MFDSNLHLNRELQAIAERQRELAARVTRLAPVDGLHPSAVPMLTMIRTSVPTELSPVVYEPSLCIVVQGRKRLMLADDVIYYDALNLLVVSVTLPVMGQVIDATPEEPYLCLRLHLDIEEISRLLLETGTRPVRTPARDDRGIFIARMDESLLDAVLRMVKLLDTPDDIPVLAPGIQREIYYRVLRTELGPRLIDLAEQDGSSHRIARAIEWLKQRYASPLRIDELAGAVHMSTSSLHHRFKAVTAMSPLQYQKQLRLHEARRLMFADGVDCAAAGHRVGYESPSQFSREYRRLFGAPPRTEIAKLRESHSVA